MALTTESFQPNLKRNAIVLVSGGLDSATVLAHAKNKGFKLHALSFDYSQRHRFELEAARKVCRHIGVTEHLVMPLNLSLIGGSALTADIDVPKNRGQQRITNEIPITYVPARNTIFLAVALAWAEVLQAPDIFIGVNAIDYSGYPDCRPEYIAAFQKMANLAIKEGVEGTLAVNIHTPLIDMTKAEIIKSGMELGVDYSLTHSCYDPSSGGLACGLCDSCLLRRKGFQDAGVIDPTKYVK